MNGLHGDPHLYPVRRWLVLFFDPAGLTPFWRRLTRRGYAHCNLLHYDGVRQIWLLLDWGRDGASASFVIPERIHLILEDVLTQGGEILEWTTPYRRPRQRRVALPHCVQFVQRFLGIPGFFLRPDHLAAWMLAHGATRFIADVHPAGAYGARPGSAYLAPAPDDEVVAGA